MPIALTGRLRVSERRAADLIQAAGTGTIQTLLSAPPGQRDPGLPESMFQAILGQLLTDAPARPESGPTAAVVAFRAIAPRLDMLSQAERQLLAERHDRALSTL